MNGPGAVDTRRLSVKILSSGLAALRYLIIALVVYFAIASLLSLALEYYRKRTEPSGTQPVLIKVDPLPQITCAPEARVSGEVTQSTLSSRFNVRVNEKVYGPFWLESGRFDATVPLARQANRLSILLANEDETSSRQVPAEIRVQYIAGPLVEPQIHNILDLPDGKVLAVGTADASSSTFLETKLGSLQYTEGGYANEYGIFWLVVPLSILQAPSNYVLRTVGNVPKPTGQGGSVTTNCKPFDPVSVDLNVALQHADSRPITRSLKMEVADSSSSLVLEVTGPAQFPYFGKLVAGEMDPHRFMWSIFGYLSLGAGSLRWTALTQPDGDIKIALSAPYAQPLPYAQPFGSFSLTEGFGELGPWPLLAAQDTFSLVWKDVRPAWFAPFPAVFEPGRAVWRGPLHKLEFGMPETRVGTNPTPSPPPTIPASANSSPKSKFSELLDNWDLPDVLSVFALAPLSFLPFGWVLYALAAHPDFCRLETQQEPSPRVRIAAVAVALGVFVLYYPVQRLFLACGPYLGQGVPRWRGFDAYLILWLAALAAVSFFVWHLLRLPGWSRAGEGSIPTLVKGIAPVLVRIAAAIVLFVTAEQIARYLSSVHFGLLVQLYGLEHLPRITAWLANIIAFCQQSGVAEQLTKITLGRGEVLVLVTVLGIAGLRIFLAGLLIWLSLSVGWHMLSTKVSYNVRMVATLTCAGMILAAGLYAAKRLWNPKVFGPNAWRAFIVVGLLVGSFVVWGNPPTSAWVGGIVAVSPYFWMCVLVVSLLRSDFAAGARRARLVRWGLYILVAVSCYPASKTLGSFQDAGWLLTDLNGISKYVALAAILAWLYRKAKESTDFEGSGQHWLACALFALFVIGSAAWVLYVPVPMLLGYLIARHWLLPRGANPARQDLFEAGERRKAILQLIDRRWLSQMSDAFREAQDKKLEKSEITLAQHQEALADFEKTRPQQKEDGSPLSDRRTFAGGPYASEWSNAATSLKYAVPMAVGPVSSAVYKFASSELNNPYVVPEFVLEVILQSCYWLLIAWFFGYFYRSLRGETGLGKGLCLAVAIVVPYLCRQLLLVMPIADMRSFFIWGGWILGYCTLLGLAFDYETLRVCGFSWRQLTTIHSAPSWSIIGSSVVAALGPLAVAIFKGKALDIANFAVSFLAKLFPGPGTP